MPLVTLFESSPLESAISSEAASKFSFEQLTQAFELNSLDAAETVFARCAKRRFESLIKAPKKYVLEAEVPPSEKTWGASLLVSLSAPPLDVGAVKALVGSLVSLIETKDGSAVYLVGALNTKISEVSRGLFTFSVKQRWYFGKL